MLNVSGETVCRLVELAQAFQAQEAVTFPDDEEGVDSDDDWMEQVLADHADDPTLAEFRSVIEDLEPDQQFEVVALMWLGRGDFQDDEWEEAVALAREQWTPATAEYLLAHPLLPEHLVEGLAAFGLACNE